MVIVLMVAVVVVETSTDRGRIQLGEQSGRAAASDVSWP